MNDNQFDAILSALDRLTRAVDSLGKIVFEGANEIHADLQDIVASSDCEIRALDELTEVVRGWKEEN